MNSIESDDKNFGPYRTRRDGADIIFWFTEAPIQRSIRAHTSPNYAPYVNFSMAAGDETRVRPGQWLSGLTNGQYIRLSAADNRFKDSPDEPQSFEDEDSEGIATISFEAGRKTPPELCLEGENIVVHHIEVKAPFQVNYRCRGNACADLDIAWRSDLDRYELSNFGADTIRVRLDEVNNPWQSPIRRYYNIRAGRSVITQGRGFHSDNVRANRV